MTEGMAKALKKQQELFEKLSKIMPPNMPEILMPEIPEIGVNAPHKAICGNAPGKFIENPNPDLGRL